MPVQLDESVLVSLLVPVALLEAVPVDDKLPVPVDAPVMLLEPAPDGEADAEPVWLPELVKLVELLPVALNDNVLVELGDGVPAALAVSLPLALVLDDCTALCVDVALPLGVPLPLPLPLGTPDGLAVALRLSKYGSTQGAATAPRAADGTAVWPRLLSPQHVGVPSTSAHACAQPMVTARARAVATAAGTLACPA